MYGEKGADERIVDSLFGDSSRYVSRRDCGRVCGAWVDGAHGRQTLAGRPVDGGMASGRAAGCHGLGRKIAFVHALGAVLARRSAVLVDTLGLALAAAHTGASRAEGSATDHAGRHGRVVR